MNIYHKETFAYAILIKLIITYFVRETFFQIHNFLFRVARRMRARRAQPGPRRAGHRPAAIKLFLINKLFNILCEKLNITWQFSLK